MNLKSEPCFVSLFLVVGASAIDCLERLGCETACYVSSGTLNPTHSFTRDQSLLIGAGSMVLCSGLPELTDKVECTCV